MRVLLCPLQSVVVPLTDATGRELTVTDTLASSVQPFASVITTVYPVVMVGDTVTEVVVAVVLQL